MTPYRKCILEHQSLPSTLSSQQDQHVYVYLPFCFESRPAEAYAAVQTRETIRILFHGIVCTGHVDFGSLMLFCMHSLGDRGAPEFSSWQLRSCCVVLQLLTCTDWMHMRQGVHC